MGTIAVPVIKSHIREKIEEIRKDALSNREIVGYRPNVRLRKCTGPEKSYPWILPEYAEHKGKAGIKLYLGKTLIGRFFAYDQGTPGLHQGIFCGCEDLYYAIDRARELCITDLSYFSDVFSHLYEGMYISAATRKRLRLWWAALIGLITGLNEMEDMESEIRTICRICDGLIAHCTMMEKEVINPIIFDR